MSNGAHTLSALPHDVTAGGDLRREYRERGYIVVRNVFAKSQMDSLIEDIKAAKTRDGVSGLNKGNMSFYSSVFFHNKPIQDFISQPKIVDLLARIIGPDVWVRWDQAVAKGPGAGDFGWHQDNGYNWLQDAHHQFWIALTDMTRENGGLWLQPGSHRRFLPHKVVGNHMVYDGTPESPVFIEAKAGDVVVFSSLMLHSTLPNTTQEARWAYVIEYMSLDHFDPGIDPPYFVVARDGKPKPEFVRFYRGRLNPINQLKYLGYRRGLHWPLVRLWLERALGSARRDAGH